jgi:hypothetical protein
VRVLSGRNEGCARSDADARTLAPAMARAGAGTDKVRMDTVRRHEHS